MEHYRQRYQAIRAALENLIADGSTGRKQLAYLAACSYLNGHCEKCGAQLIRTDAALADALESVQQGTTDVPGNDELPICPACFARQNARRLLDRYRDRLCTFNDDIQGTAAVTLAGLLAAVDLVGSKMSEQRIVILGAGSAATGIADQIVAAMVREGCALPGARYAIWLVDSQGLVHTGRTDLDAGKKIYAQPRARIAEWHLPRPDHMTLEDVVREVRPTILIGTAAQPRAFTEGVVREMARHVSRPIIFPLSNPTTKSEAAPVDLLAWTAGRALVATGNPFPAVSEAGRLIRIGQCNNVFIFPGVGLGVLAPRSGWFVHRSGVRASACIMPHHNPV